MNDGKRTLWQRFGIECGARCSSRLRPLPFEYTPGYLCCIPRWYKIEGNGGRPWVLNNCRTCSSLLCVFVKLAVRLAVFRPVVLHRSVLAHLGAHMPASPHSKKLAAPIPTKRASQRTHYFLSLIHISEPTRLRRISYAVFCLKKKN